MARISSPYIRKKNIGTFFRTSHRTSLGKSSKKFQFRGFCMWFSSGLESKERWKLVRTLAPRRPSWDNGASKSRKKGLISWGGWHWGTLDSHDLMKGWSINQQWKEDFRDEYVFRKSQHFSRLKSEPFFVSGLLGFHGSRRYLGTHANIEPLKATNPIRWEAGPLPGCQARGSHEGFATGIPDVLNYVISWWSLTGILFQKTKKPNLVDVGGFFSPPIWNIFFGQVGSTSSPGSGW